MLLCLCRVLNIIVTLFGSDEFIILNITWQIIIDVNTKSVAVGDLKLLYGADNIKHCYSYVKSLLQNYSYIHGIDIVCFVVQGGI